MCFCEIDLSKSDLDGGTYNSNTKEITWRKDLVIDTKEYIENKCSDNKYISKYKKLGDSTNFFFKKTIYRVKK